MSKIFTCTPDCEGRKPGCHDHCEKYQRERAEWERRKAIENRDMGLKRYTLTILSKKANNRAINKKNKSSRKWYSND